MSLSRDIQSKGGKAVAKKVPPHACPICGWFYPWHYLWHNHLGHLARHKFADRYFGGDMRQALRWLQNNALAAIDPMPWNNAWPKRKPLPPKKEPGPPCGCMAAPYESLHDYRAEDQS